MVGGGKGATSLQRLGRVRTRLHRLEDLTEADVA